MSDLVIIANRLPVSVSRVDGKLAFSHANGGVATAMNSLNIENQLWIGWPGIASDNLTGAEKAHITKELKKSNCLPIFLTEAEVADFYEGYANDTLWPLFHYFPSIAKHKEQYWHAYRLVNKKYLKAAQKVADAHSTFWVHDYHFMIMPSMLRELFPDAKIGFFLHVPFPSYEVFRLLPERHELIEGLMGADLIGFHIYDYARHFMSSAERILGARVEGSSIQYQNRHVKVDVFPIGIDYQKFRRALRRKEVQDEIALLNERYEGQKLILSIDRLDYSKGIMNRLEAYELFLKQHPELHRSVTLIMIAAPSRTEVGPYKELRNDIEHAVSRINGVYGTTDWAPISYQFQNLRFEPITALCARAEVALVTPMRDGMNLVSKEYIASQQGTTGVLILSEMTGAASELNEALIVNPNNIAEMAHAMHKALKMPKAEQHRRLRAMQARLSDYTVQDWGEDFLKQLSSAKQLASIAYSKRMASDQAQELVREFSKKTPRLLLIDYDGTLQSFKKSPNPALARPSKRVKNILRRLVSDNNNRIFIVSGRSKTALDSWFKDIPRLGLVAEHGAWEKVGGKWEKRLEDFDKKTLLDALRECSKRTPGSLVEEKDFAVVWHYRNVVPELAYVRNGDLAHTLRELTHGTNLVIRNGHKIIEVKPGNANKGDISRSLLDKYPSKFIFAVGDDYTDEDMFAALPSSAETIKVGPGETKAKYQMSRIESLIGLLEELSLLS